MYHSFLIHLSAYGHLGCLQVLACQILLNCLSNSKVKANIHCILITHQFSAPDIPGQRFYYYKLKKVEAFKIKTKFSIILMLVSGRKLTPKLFFSRSLVLQGCNVVFYHLTENLLSLFFIIILSFKLL